MPSVDAVVGTILTEARPRHHEVAATIHGHGRVFLVTRCCLVDKEFTANFGPSGIEPLTIDAPSAAVLVLAGPDHDMATVASRCHRMCAASQFRGCGLNIRGGRVNERFGPAGEHSLNFISPDVRCAVAGRASRIQGRSGNRAAHVDGGTARQQAMGRDESLINLQRGIEARVDIALVGWSSQPCSPIAVDVVTQRSQCLIRINPGRILQHRVLQRDDTEATLSKDAISRRRRIEGNC